MIGKEAGTARFIGLVKCTCGVCDARKPTKGGACSKGPYSKNCGTPILSNFCAKACPDASARPTLAST